MADAPSDQSHRDERGGVADVVGMPRWVKVFAIVGAVLLLLVVVMLLVGGGPAGHGPRPHVGTVGDALMLAIPRSIAIPAA